MSFSIIFHNFGSHWDIVDQLEPRLIRVPPPKHVPVWFTQHHPAPPRLSNCPTPVCCESTRYSFYALNTLNILNALNAGNSEYFANSVDAGNAMKMTQKWHFCDNCNDIFINLDLDF